MQGTRAEDKVFWRYVQHKNALAEIHGKVFTEFLLGQSTYINNNGCNIAVLGRSPDQLIGLIESLGKDLIVKFNRLIVSALVLYVYMYVCMYLFEQFG